MSLNVVLRLRTTFRDIFKRNASLRGRRKKGREKSTKEGRQRQKGEGEGEGEGEKHERGEREGSACYKSRCFCNPPTIFSTNPIVSLSIRDQSQVRGFSAWSELKVAEHSFADGQR